MKKKRRHIDKKKKKSTATKNRKNLRSGSKEIKRILLAADPHCDICGSDKSLQLHHIYLIRHGFESELDHCVLLCANCHVAFHKKWDKYLDITFHEDPDADFVAIYNVIKKL
jgi:5-methylcytosine-specific restriction endonuclease McrA